MQTINTPKGSGRVGAGFFCWETGAPELTRQSNLGNAPMARNAARSKPILIPPRPSRMNGLGCPGGCPSDAGSRIPLRAQYATIPDGDAGIKQTIAQMMRFVTQSGEGARHPEVRRAAIAATGGVDSRDYDGELRSILQWVKQNIKFRGEFRETIQTPLVTLALGAGDCDDFSILIAALARALGYQTRFRTVAADADAPGEFSHVFPEVQHKKTGEWIPLDATVASSYAGWAPSVITRNKAWPAMNGLGQLADAAQDVTNILTNFSNAVSPSLPYAYGSGDWTKPNAVPAPGSPYLSPGAYQSLPSSTILGIPVGTLLLGGLVIGAGVAIAHSRRRRR